MAGKKNPLVSEAIRLVDDEGLSIYEAAKRVNVSQASVYSAFNRRKAKIMADRLAGVCEKCGAPVDSHGKFAPNKESHGHN